jgi:hypothetical protein
MNTTRDSTQLMSKPAAAGISVNARKRSHRAAVAQRLLAKAPEAVATLEWDAFDSAPGWLALSETEFALLQRQIGAMLCAPALRLWIDGPRLAAARTALGESFLQALLAQPAAPANPVDLAACPRIDVAGQVGALLQIAGASVMVAALPQGPLRRATSAALAPATASPIGQELARSMVQRAQNLAAQSSMNIKHGGSSLPSELRSAA